MVVKRSHKIILDAIKRGARLWNYSSNRIGWLVENGTSRMVRRTTIDAMEEAGLIEEDETQGCSRAHMGSDIVWKVKV